MRVAGQLWLVNDPAVQADAMIVLGDDNYDGDRAAHAADLYRMGLAPIVVASGRYLRPYAGIAEMMERDLESRGVPAASIVKFSHRAENTREEAEALAGLIASRGWKRVLVVTSNYHARRARFIFERVLPAGVSVHVSGAHDSEFDPSRWWETRLGQKFFQRSAWLRRSVVGVAGEGRCRRPRIAPIHAVAGEALRSPLLRSPPVTDWKHTRFTGTPRCTIVRSLPSSPGCFASAPACGYGVSVGGDIHVA